MNDLERDLRDLLREDARRVPAAPAAPDGLRRSIRRRQALFAGVVGLSGLAIVAAVVAGATMVLPNESGPVPAAETTTGNLSGIMITYPSTWYLIDPDRAGLNGSPTMGESPLPRIVIALAPTETPETFGCPGRVGGNAAPLLMTIQEVPLAVEGSAAAPWPVELEPMSVDASESACYPDWEFLRAGWTASGRTFEARVGLAPESTSEDREALLTAFASMRFEPARDGATAAVLATGTAGGEEWQLIATRQADGLSLSLDSESSGSGTGGYDPTSDQLLLTSFVIGDDERAARIVFGAVPAAAVRVRTGVSGEGPDPGPAPAILDVPDEIDPRLNAFVFTIGEGQTATIEAFDAQGNVVARGSLGADEAQPAAPLEDGRHFGYVRWVDVAGDTIEFDLAYFLSGEEANQAYQEATGDTGPVPNDHFVVNDNPQLRTLALAPDLRLRLLDWHHCCDTFFDGDLRLFAQAVREQTDVADGDLIYRGQSQWWITVENGVVTEIEEQYSP